MKITSTLVGLAALLSASQAMAEPLSFRGLSASSKSADVRRVFPKVQPQNYCQAGETVRRSADGETLCAELTVDNYMLDNIPFHVTFGFNPGGTLRFVSLFRSYGTFETDEGSVSASTINSTFTSLADLLSSKYGPAVADLPESFLRQGPVDQELEWQPGRGARWLSGGDRISLKSRGTESRTAPGVYRGSVQIFYSFAKRDEFDRF